MLLPSPADRLVSSLFFSSVQEFRGVEGGIPSIVSKPTCHDHRRRARGYE